MAKKENWQNGVLPARSSFKYYQATNTSLV